MARALAVLTEVGALDRAFDYLDRPDAPYGVGDRVRVELNHRSLRGWVVGAGDESRAEKPVTRWLGYGPPPAVVDLAAWAARRWYSPRARFLAAASPARVVAELPEAPARIALHGQGLVAPAGTLLVAPTLDPLALVLGALAATDAADGSLVVVVPTEAWAARLAARLERRGVAVALVPQEWARARAGWPVVVGARGAAFAPVARLAGAVVVDADDDALRSSAAPTYDAATVLRERGAREGAPVWLASTMPSPALLDRGAAAAVGPGPDGWPRVIALDRRGADPHEGALAPAALEAARAALDTDEAVAVVVVLQRTGAGAPLACRRCGELARCATCHQAEREVDGALRCADAHARRARFCAACGSTALRRVGPGVTTLARDVAAQLGRPVSEVTAATRDAALERVVVGTEAALTRVRRCALVVIADLDQYLLAPRASARRAAVQTVGRAGRLVGPRSSPRGPVIVQTRRGDDEVVAALVRGDVAGLVAADDALAAELGLPPYGAAAAVSGEGAREFVESVDASVAREDAGSTITLRAASLDALLDALASAPRPHARVRVAVE